MKKNNWIFFLLISIHLFLVFNLRFEAWPEMLVYPYLLGKGFKLYQDIINPYLPLFTLFLGLFFKFFSVTVINLKLFTWTLIIITDTILYIIAKKKYGLRSAIIALSFFVVFQPLLDGNGLWYDLSLVPILLLAFYWQSPWILSIGFFVKQSAVYLFLLFLKNWQRLAGYLAIIFLFLSIFFIWQGTFDAFWFWAFKYTFTIFPASPGHKDLSFSILWALAVLPLLAPLTLSIINKKAIIQKNNPAANPFTWALITFLFIFPRFGLFHLQPFLAFVSLSLASQLKNVKVNKILIPTSIYLLLVSLFWWRHLNLFWHQPDRFFEPSIITAAKKLKRETTENRPLLFLNAPEQLLVLTNRLPIKPWAATFPWYFQASGLEEKLIIATRFQSTQAVVFSPFQSQGKSVPGSFKPLNLSSYVNENFPNTLPIGNGILLKHE